MTLILPAGTAAGVRANRHMCEIAACHGLLPCSKGNKLYPGLAAGKHNSTFLLSTDGHPSKYKPGPTLLDFGAHVGTGWFNVALSIAPYCVLYIFQGAPWSMAKQCGT